MNFIVVVLTLAVPAFTIEFPHSESQRFYLETVVGLDALPNLGFIFRDCAEQFICYSMALPRNEFEERIPNQNGFNNDFKEYASSLNYDEWTNAAGAGSSSTDNGHNCIVDYEHCPFDNDTLSEIFTTTFTGNNN